MQMPFGKHAGQELADNLGTVVPIPQTESQARPLARLASEIKQQTFYGG